MHSSERQHHVCTIPDFWEIYATAKYQGRDLRGMRDLLNKPAAPASLGDLLIDLCECAWRSGLRPQDLHAAAAEELRRRKATRNDKPFLERAWS